MRAGLERYGCQMALPGFTEAAQLRLQQARVLVAGAGGLGCPAAQYLAAAGIGSLGIADFDTVSISNLHRQILYEPADIGKKKALVAAARLQAQNPDIRVLPLDLKIKAGNVLELLAAYDLVVDATDNFESRYLLNDAAVLTGKPLVYGAIYQYEGQLALWNALNADGSRSPHYRDLFPEVDASRIPDCSQGGVLPTLAGIIGCMQANEAIRYLAGIGEPQPGHLLILDARNLQSRSIQLGTTSRVPVTGLPQTVAVPSIRPETLKKELDAYELIDVRTAEERMAFHIGGRHLPLPFPEGLMELSERGKPLVCYCASGRRSETAVRILLVRFPHRQVYTLAGGLSAWKEA